MVLAERIYPLDVFIQTVETVLFDISFS
jgi:hypothetical protein